MDSLAGEISVVQNTLVGQQGAVKYILPHPKAKTIITSVEGGKSVQIWDLSSRNVIQQTVKMASKSPISCVG